MWTIKVESPPPVEPITLTEAKAHLRYDLSDEDDLVEALIVSARQWCEEYTRRKFITQTVSHTLDTFPCGVWELQGGNVQSISSITYIDAAGDPQIMPASDYISELTQLPARVEPAPGEAWPATQRRIGAATITYVVGYEPELGSPTDYAAAVPRPIRHAMLMLLAHMFENREAVAYGNPSEMPLAVEPLLQPYRVMWG